MPLRRAQLTGRLRITEKKLQLGNINVQRDWGWAPEYVDAMWRMLQIDKPEDFVIATGQTRSLLEFTKEAFNYCGLHWPDHVVTNSSLLRPTDIMVSRANPSRANERLGWRAKRMMAEVIRGMIEDEITL